MNLTHVAKEIVGTVATPLTCGLLFALAGAGARLAGWRRSSIALWVTAAFIVYLPATSPVADALLMPLESRYRPLSDTGDLPPVQFIVVLGSSYAPRDGNPITAALMGDGLVRIAEGVRLMRRVPGARLIVSGGAPAGQTASAIGYSRFAVDFGVDASAIVKLDTPLDTAEEASGVAALVGSAPFILVTSAYHMPRAMRLMQLAGARPIPAPTGQMAPRQIDFDARGWIPRSSSLRKTERALHEYMGLAILH
jgi:uncharacterized SAM-binding protein YcdF (DUF218 family)